MSICCRYHFKVLGLRPSTLSVRSHSLTTPLRLCSRRPATLEGDTEDMVGSTRGIIGVEVGLLFLEQPAGGVKISFRSREQVDVAKLAEQFGGGGHRLASGATLQTTLPEAQRRVLDAVRQALPPHAD